MRLISIALLSALALPAAEIPKGAHALLKLVNSISSRTAREGDYVYLRTASPIVADGTVIVPVDSYVTGVVTHAKRSGRVTGRAELSIRIETLTLASGKVVKMTPTLTSVDSEGTDQKVVGKESEIKQGGSKGADAEKIATTGGVGAAIGGLADRSWRGAGIGAGAGAGVGLATVLLTRGKEVDLHQGATIDVVFDRAIPMD
jgi:type IV secretion system protein VirB10